MTPVLTHVQELRWVRKPADLEYDFAGRRLATVTFAANVCASPFTSLGSHPPDEAAVAALDGDAELSVFYSHPVESPLPRLTALDRALRYAPRHFRHYWVDTIGSFDDYLGGLSAKSRQTIRRKVRRYCEHAGTDTPWREYDTRAQLDEFHALARPLSSRTYQERLLDAGLPQTPDFLDRLYASGGTGRGFILFDGSRPVAYLFTPVRDGRAVYKFLGFDTAYAEWSPGLVLQHFALSRLFADPAVEMLDFTEGEGQHKSVFATDDAFCADVYYFRPTRRARFAVRAHITLRALDAGAKTLLRHAHLHRPLRQLIRRRAGKAP